MDTYLEIAEQVLQTVKRPLSARTILSEAYKAEIVPYHLYGKTQHKTLQARLSEDILKQANNSRFYRTEPGVFFLTAFENDPNIPEDYKVHFSARRRLRDLTPDLALVLDGDANQKITQGQVYDWSEFVDESQNDFPLKFARIDREDEAQIPVLSFSIVRKHDQLLSYRIGRYREGRDEYVNKRTIGFTGMVGYEDVSLFAPDDYGISESGLKAVLSDLDLSISVFDDKDDLVKPEILFAFKAYDGNNKEILLLVMEWLCPEWFEPVGRRLSLNSLLWIGSSTMPNDMDDFEPWSITTLQSIVKGNTAR